MIFLKDGQDKWTVAYNGKSCVFDKSHINYQDLVNAVINSDEEAFGALFVSGEDIENWSEGDFKVTDGYITYKDRALSNVLSDYILGLIKEGRDHGPILKFTENLYKNPSFKVLDRLYKFLSHKNLPITSDGCFLGYKAVTANFLDKHTEKIDNRVGVTPSVERNKVDDDMETECSYGLHVGTLSYVQDFRKPGDNVIICKVNPADVVAVPYADAQKLRCCRYEVVDVYKEALSDVYDDSYDEEEEWSLWRWRM